MSKALVVTYGFFGDIFFSTSIAERLRHSEIDYMIGFPQPKKLVENHPNISKVFVSDSNNPKPIYNRELHNDYDDVFELGPVSFNITPPEELQLQCGIDNPSSTFKVYTDSDVDENVIKYFDKLRKDTGKKILCWLANWEARCFQFTEEEYQRGIDVPHLGYGGRKRDINHIISELAEEYNMIDVGFPGNVTQYQTAENIPIDDNKSLLVEASILKNCDYFIGAEGGLCNLAAGVGTKTIITGDFIHQLYGWNGVVKKITEPKLGPEFYFDDGHFSLDPYLTDEEVVNEIRRIIE
jgi:hypothetical protein